MLAKWLLATSLAALYSVGVCQTNGNPSSDDYTCSSTKPCKIGCCSNSGVCGMGPTFCGAGNCTSSCDAKSDCDPGYGSQWAKAEKCPLNVCCSKFGFCGTTSDFCGTEKVTKPTCNGGTSSNQRVMGYYEGWSTTRACGGLYPEDIPYSAYTHLNYAFALIDPNSFAVAPMSPGDPELMQRLTALKQINPGLQVWLSIGGWSMNDPDQPTAKTFSQLAGSTSAQSAFFTSLIQIMQNYGFDGVDIDWEYPVAPERSGNPQDFANYPTFLTNLKSALAASGHNYGLTITLPSSYWYLQNFDIVKIEPIVDWFNVMTYDLHGTWDSSDPYIGPYVYAHTNLTEIDQTMDLMWRNKISPSKITLGLGFYGRSFTLSDPNCKGPGCGFSAGGDPGPCTASAGTLSFSEIEDIIANNNPTVTLDSNAAVKIVNWNGNQWVSYDDEETLKLKVDYANNNCLGGVMVWASSLDNANGDAAAALSNANGRSNLKLSNKGASSSTLTACVWGQCVDPKDKTALQCPGGLAPAQRSDGGGGRGNTGIYTGCPGGQQRNFCCPTSDRPTCTWRGTASLCRHAACADDEVQVASDRKGTGKTCDFNHKNLCCQKTISDLAFGLCQWVGSAPVCNFFGGNRGQASCPKGLSALTEDKDGAGGEQACGASEGYKTYCCPDPAPFNNCGWYNNSQTYDYWPRLDNHFSNMPIRGSCSGGCPNGQTPIAADSTACTKSTTAYFCCDDPKAGSNPAPDPGDDTNLCDIPAGIIDESGQSEPEDPNNSATELELYEQEGDCYVGGVADSGDPSQPEYKDEFKRSIDDLNERAEAGEDVGEELMLLMSGLPYEHFNDLEKRGASRSSKLCKNKPGKNRNKVTQSLKSTSYRGVKDLLKLNKKVFTANKKACGPKALTSGSVLVSGYKFVAEHVWEQQGVKTFLQSMIDGVGPGGNPITAGVLSWTPFSSTSSAFFKTWASAGVSWTGAGTTPMETFYSILGTLSDSDNLLILDSQTNGMKAVIWQGGKSLVSASTWKGASHLVRLGLISKIKSACDYMNSPEAQAIFQDIFTKTLAACTSFQAVLAKAGITYDVPGAFKQFTAQQFAFMTSNVLSWTANLPSATSITAEIAYWGSAAAASQYTAKVAKANQASLQAMFTTIGTWAQIKAPS